MILYMLIGLPGSGKSTWISNHLKIANFHNASSYYIYSTDNIIIDICSKYQEDYNDNFKTLYAFADRVSNKNLFLALREKKIIIWDQTNLSKASRKLKLSKIPKEYKKVAVSLEVPIDTCYYQTVLRCRPISKDIIQSMNEHYEAPSQEEGFNEIIIEKRTTYEKHD